MLALRPDPLSSRSASRSASALCLAALGLSTVAFVAKYAADLPAVSRAGAVGLGVAAALAYGAVILGVSRRDIVRPRLADGLVAVAVGAAVVLAWTAPEANAVARSPAVGAWLSALADGAYPYGVAHRPSGMPGLFALLSPFWAAKALWLVAPAGIGLTWLAARRVVSAQGRLTVALAFLGLPAVWYEVVVRSELVLNGAFVVIAALLGARAIRRRHTWPIIGAAVLGGVVLSTRLTAGVALLAVGLVWLRRAPRPAVGYGLVAVGVFAATLLPFVVWDPVRFAELGPFAIQGLYLPTAAKLSLIAAAVAVGLRAQSTRGALVGAGLVIWAGAALSLGVRVAEIGWGDALWGDGFDVGYLALGVPLLLLGIGSRDDADPSVPALA